MSQRKRKRRKPPVRKVSVLECFCARCGWTWISRATDEAGNPRPPVRCASCRSPYWKTPPKT